LPADDQTAEKRERTAGFARDFGRPRQLRHPALDRGAQERHLMELAGIGQCRIHALARGLEGDRLMNRLHGRSGLPCPIGDRASSGAGMDTAHGRYASGHG